MRLDDLCIFGHGAHRDDLLERLRISHRLMTLQISCHIKIVKIRLVFELLFEVKAFFTIDGIPKSVVSDAVNSIAAFSALTEISVFVV